jgi:hypothetical protein
VEKVRLFYSRLHFQSTNKLIEGFWIHMLPIFWLPISTPNSKPCSPTYMASMVYNLSPYDFYPCFESSPIFSIQQITWLTVTANPT